MSRLTASLAPVPIRSFTKQRVDRRPVPAPEVGLRWGARSDFEFLLAQADREDRDGGGVVIIQPERRRTLDRVRRFSPVWRRYEVWRVRSPHDPEAYVDVAVTREALIPVGSETQLYVGGGIGYVLDPGRYQARERVIHTYVLLRLPPPVLENAEQIGGGTVGDWPSYPEDAWSAGTVAAEVGGAPYGSTGGLWDR